MTSDVQLRVAVRPCAASATTRPMWSQPLPTPARAPLGAKRTRDDDQSSAPLQPLHLLQPVGKRLHPVEKASQGFGLYLARSACMHFDRVAHPFDPWVSVRRLSRAGALLTRMASAWRPPPEAHRMCCIGVSMAWALAAAPLFVCMLPAVEHVYTCGEHVRVLYNPSSHLRVRVAEQREREWHVCMGSPMSMCQRPPCRLCVSETLE